MFCSVHHLELSPLVSFNSLTEQYEFGFEFKMSAGVCENGDAEMHVFLGLIVCNRKLSLLVGFRVL